MAIANKKLTQGAKRLHIVAPPGSGKTILGLYLWAQCIRRPALVLSPNSAIQAQWAAKCELFDGTNQCAISTDVQSPGLLTSLTYQAITIPGRGDDDLDAAARGLWREKLIEKGQAKDPEEAEIWLADLLRHNAGYYEQRLGSYRKQLRDARAIGGEALATLHASALASLERLKQQRIGLIILDECHHLLGHWGRVLADAHDLLEEPVIVGLTATPPDRDGKLPADVLRYDEFLGPVDYEVPVPAVVKDGFLAPYQDLAYFVRPRPEELSFIANADDELHAIVRELCDAGAFADQNVVGTLRVPLADEDEPAETDSDGRRSVAAAQDGT
ncbi:MAG: DEAD/DEAH box helicase family protein, partial [Pirellulaceae bacterium]